jgi:hypothetical protein
MPHGDRAALDGFIDELRRVWVIAGPPTYQDFEKLSMKVSGPAETGGMCLPRSTTQDVLAGRRQQPPKWRWVARFITVLRVAAAEAGVDPGCVGTLVEWKRKHLGACTAFSAAEPAQAAGDDPAAPAITGPLGRPRGARPGTGLLLADREAGTDLALAALLRAAGQDWWRGYRDVVPGWRGAYLSLESAASQIRVYDTSLVHALLQTQEYAEAAIRISAPDLSQASVARLAELRMHRQQMLARPEAPALWAIVDETAVRRRLGDAQTMRAQIRHLIEISHQPNITIQVIPSDTSVHAVAGGPITFLRFPRTDLPDVVYLEQLTGALYLSRKEDVSHYMTVLGGLAIEALEPAETTDFLREILMKM